MKYILIIVLALSLSVCSSLKSEKEGSFTVDLDSPKVSAGTLEAQFDKVMGIAGLKQEPLTIDYYPLEDAVCTQYRINFMTYYLFWDRDGRDAYIKALEKYKEDFANRTLKPRGSRNTRRNYGKIQSYLIWQASIYTTRSKSSMFTELGYDIKSVAKNKASFFAIYQREGEYIDKNSSKDIRRTQSILIYLTRAKADELAAFFNQDFLDNLVPDNIKKLNQPIPLDTY